MSDQNPPAGWYKSPNEENVLRWWDGDSWTDVSKAIEDASGSLPSAPDGTVSKITDSLPKPKAEQILDYVVGGSLAAGGAAIAVDGAANLVKKKTGAGKWFVMGVVLIAISILMFIQAIAGFFGPERVESAGYVIELIQDESSDSYCNPVVEFTVNGQVKTTQLATTESCRWSLGDEVAVFYDKNTNGRNPMLEKATESWDTLFSSAGSFLFGVVLMVIGFVKLGARAAQAGVGAFVAKKGYDKLKKTSKNG